MRTATSRAAAAGIAGALALAAAGLRQHRAARNERPAPAARIVLTGVDPDRPRLGLAAPFGAGPSASSSPT